VLQAQAPIEIILIEEPPDGFEPSTGCLEDLLLLAEKHSHNLVLGSQIRQA
jgi:hypothetical protein